MKRTRPAADRLAESGSDNAARQADEGRDGKRDREIAALRR
jgi:hypothetical protein